MKKAVKSKGKKKPINIKQLVSVHFSFVDDGTPDATLETAFIAENYKNLRNVNVSVSDYYERSTNYSGIDCC